MAHLGDQLKDYRIGENWQQPEMAKYLSVGLRTYQDIEKTGIVKKLDVLERIKIKTGLNTQISAYENGELMPVLVHLMKTQNRILEDQKTELVDRMKRVESNLTGLVIGQKSVLAHVATILEKDDERDAGGNKRKEQSLKDETGKRIVDKISAVSQRDNPVGR